MGENKHLVPKTRVKPSQDSIKVGSLYIHVYGPIRETKPQPKLGTKSKTRYYLTIRCYDMIYGGIMHKQLHTIKPTVEPTVKPTLIRCLYTVRVTMLQNSMVNMIMRTLYLQKLNMMLKETKVLKTVNR